MVVLLLGILAAVVVSHVAGAGDDAREATLSANLKMGRRQIVLYTAEHFGLLPCKQPDGSAASDAEFMARMIGKTRPDGTIDPADACGPYVRRWPANPFAPEAGARRVLIGDAPAPPRDGTTGWYLSSVTGLLYPNSKEGGACYDPPDAVAPAPGRADLDDRPAPMPFR